jgi:hypothetical protein
MTAPGVLIAPEDLDELLTVASAGHFAAGASEALHARSGSQTAQEQSRKATNALLTVCQRLEALGAQDRAPLVKPAPVNPLAELARVENSRSEALALLDSLATARLRAEILDDKRGTGEDWAELLSELESKLKLELFGPSGAVTGARE